MISELIPASSPAVVPSVLPADGAAVVQVLRLLVNEGVTCLTINSSLNSVPASSSGPGWVEWDSSVTGEFANGTYACDLLADDFVTAWSGNVTVAGSTLDPASVVMA